MEQETGMINKRMGLLSVLWSGIKLSFLQAAWNFERLQNIGFLFSVMNVLKSVYKDDREALLRAINRHLSFFNTNIFFASAVLGVIARLEEEVDDKNPEQKNREIENTKIGIMGPLAAIGDSLFYFGIKPLAMLAGGGIVILAGYTVEGLIWAAAVSIALFNLPKIFIKYYLLIKAY
ncbi:MAG TPA: hypothetical protein ENN43_02770, partial [bacterium]|nr:hypothetical protein [bacterium]